MTNAKRHFRSSDVIDCLTDLFIKHGVPEHVRSDNGSEFIAANVRIWFEELELKPLFITPGRPWENGYIESFNGKMRDELFKGEVFYSSKEVQVMIETCRKHYNTVRTHSSLGYRPPPPETFTPNEMGFARRLVAM